MSGGKTTEEFRENHSTINLLNQLGRLRPSLTNIMIIKGKTTKRHTSEIADMCFHRDDLTIHHTQNAEPAMEMAYLHRLHSDNGFTKKRTMRLIGEIPALVFYQHRDEFLRDPDSIKKYLKTDEGQHFKCVDNLRF